MIEHIVPLDRSDYTVRVACRLCSSPDLALLLTLPDTPLANEYVGPNQDRFPLHLVGCKACGHVQLPVVVDPKRLFPPDYPYQSGTSAVFREHLRDFVVALNEHIPQRSAVLDVACNDGTLVEQLREHGRGYVAHGIDPSAPDKPGLFHEFFGEYWAARRRGDFGAGYECITALNVFAHVDDLDDFTRGVKTLLEPCGLFVIEVGYLKDVVEKGRWTTIYHEHLSYHHLSPLVRFFKKHEMTLVDAQRIDSQGGSIRLYVRNCDKEHVGGDDGHNEPSARLQDLLDEEGRSELWQGVRELNDGSAYRGVRLARDRLKATAPHVLYGAPAKLTTLLHATDTADLVQYVVDDNPRKQGRYVPGTRIPILPVSTLYERRPKRVTITAWNFAEEIKQKHAELGCEWEVSCG